MRLSGSLRIAAPDGGHQSPQEPPWGPVLPGFRPHKNPEDQAYYRGGGGLSRGARARDGSADGRGFSLAFDRPISHLGAFFVIGFPLPFSSTGKGLIGKSGLIFCESETSKPPASPHGHGISQQVLLKMPTCDKILTLIFETVFAFKKA